MSAPTGCGHTAAREPRLLDHLVGEREQRRGNLEAERLRRLQIDDELELGHLQDRQVGWLLAHENAARIGAGLPKHIGKVRSVAHQPAGIDIITHRIARRNRVAHRQHGKLNTPAVEEPIAADKKSVCSLGCEGREGRIDFANGAGVEHLDLLSQGAGSRLNVSKRPLAASLNNLVHECEQICGHIETECLGGLEIDG
jgi:hypothetical protein